MTVDYRADDQSERTLIYEVSALFVAHKRFGLISFAVAERFTGRRARTATALANVPMALRDVFPYDVVIFEDRYALCGSSRSFVFGLRDEPIKLAKGFCPRLPIVNYSASGDGRSVSRTCHKTASMTPISLGTKNLNRNRISS